MLGLRSSAKHREKVFRAHDRNWKPAGVSKKMTVATNNVGRLPGDSTRENHIIVWVQSNNRGNLGNRNHCRVPSQRQCLLSDRVRSDTRIPHLNSRPTQNILEFGKNFLAENQHYLASFPHSQDFG